MKTAIAIAICIAIGLVAGYLTGCSQPKPVVVDHSAEVERLKKVNEQLKRDLTESEQTRNRLQIDLEHAVNRCPVKPQRSNFIIKQKAGVA